MSENPPGNPGIQVAAFYKFVRLNGLQDLQRGLLDTCEAGGLLGTILLAHEGINGTVAGPREGMQELFTCCRRVTGLEDLALQGFLLSAESVPPHESAS